MDRRKRTMDFDRPLARCRPVDRSRLLEARPKTRAGQAGLLKAGKSERSIMKQTGHRSVTVVRRYIRDAELFDDNAAAGIGL